jgi:uncharacterized protein YbaP (TraB family)
MRQIGWLALVLLGGVAFGQGGVEKTGPAGAQSRALPKSVAADPAIWRVKGAHGTVYLFGSVHVMKPEVQWESAKVKSALTASDVIYLEIANIDDAAAAQPLVMKYGLDMEHPLSTKISKEDVALLDGVAKTIGMPGEQAFEAMQPWVVSLTLTVMPMLKAGYAPTSGIDLKLLAESKGESKPVKGFETMADQVHMLADVPQAEQVAMLHKDLTELDKSAGEMDEIVAAWEKGDVETIGRLENAELAERYPTEYKRLVVDRNAKWAATIDGLLKDEHTGTVFVVVGAAHLAGPDSVVKRLEKDGYTVVRE